MNRFTNNSGSKESMIILDVKSANLSEIGISNVAKLSPKKYCSEINVRSGVTYDDLCENSAHSDSSVYGRYVDSSPPNFCLWKYITQEDAVYLEEYQQDKRTVIRFLENKFLSDKLHKGKRNNVVKILWEVFKFARKHFFNKEATSAALAAVYTTHLFFLSHPWRAHNEIYLYFREMILLHAVLVSICFVYLSKYN